MGKKSINRPFLLLIVTAIAMTVVGLLRRSMMESLLVALGIAAGGGVWMAVSDRRFRQGLLGLYTAMVIAVPSLIIVGYLMRNSIGERLADAAAILMFLLVLVPATYALARRRRKDKGEQSRDA